MKAPKSKESIWIAKPRPALGSGRLPREVDLLIIGAGVAGAAIAYHATQEEMSVAVIEARHPAARASGRNDGQVLLGLGEHLNRIVGQLGLEDAISLWRYIEKNHEALYAAVNNDRIACDFQREGGLRLAASESEMAELAESATILARECIPHRLLSSQDVASELPLVHGFHGALYLEGEAIMDPCALVHGLLAQAKERGLHLRLGHAVKEIAGELGKFRVTLDNGASLECKVLVHATSSLARDLDRSGFLTRHVFSFRGQLLATKAIPQKLAEQMPPWAMSSNFCYEYFRMHNNVLTLGGMRWAVRGEEVGIVDDSEINPLIAEKLREYLREHFPAFGKIKIARDWTGIMAGTADGLPLLGAIPGFHGEYLCLGFNGYGMSFAFLAGKHLCEMVINGRAEDPALKLFDPRRLDEDTLLSDRFLMPT